MVKIRQKNKKRSYNTKMITHRRIIIFAACISMTCVAACLSLIYQNTFYNKIRQNELNTGIVTEKTWAQRLELPGVPNFYKASDKLYRGAQPTVEGMIRLQELGIKTVVNLRSSRSDHDEIAHTGLKYEQLDMTTLMVRTKDVIKFLQIVTDNNNTPVFVHCRRGADRTGLMCAIYRVVVEGWSKTEAIDEMTKGGFGFFSGWKNLVNYILKLDVEEIKRNTRLNE
jgi:protein tyrosine phosphatase (PTP) superfamily phosphohydrolase (DUF442 family)